MSAVEKSLAQVAEKLANEAKSLIEEDEITPIVASDKQEPMTLKLESEIFYTEDDKENPMELVNNSVTSSVSAEIKNTSQKYRPGDEIPTQTIQEEPQRIIPHDMPFVEEEEINPEVKYDDHHEANLLDTLEPTVSSDSVDESYAIQTSSSPHGIKDKKETRDGFPISIDGKSHCK